MVAAQRVPLSHTHSMHANRGCATLVPLSHVEKVEGLACQSKRADVGPRPPHLLKLKRNISSRVPSLSPARAPFALSETPPLCGVCVCAKVIVGR